MWIPSAKSIEDLSVEESEEGLALSAPDGTECAAWLAYYDSTDELREEFNTFFVDAIMERVNRIQGEHGGQEQNAERIQEDRVQAEENQPRPLGQLQT